MLWLEELVYSAVTSNGARIRNVVAGGAGVQCGDQHTVPVTSKGARIRNILAGGAGVQCCDKQGTQNQECFGWRSWCTVL
jgi:hypothetical protein